MTVATMTVLDDTQRESLEQLLTPELQGKLLRTCHRICFGDFDGDDLFGMTLMKVTSSFRTFTGDAAGFQAWCFRVLYSVFKNELAARARRLKCETLPDSMLEGWDAGIAMPYHLEDDVLSGTYGEKLSAALQTLHHRQREALILYAEGYTYAEIVTLQKSTIGTVCSRVRRARNRAKAALSTATVNQCDR